jgi:uncharacterized protein DUF5916/cellulose/xylan binding protein with CBM9 domain
VIRAARFDGASQIHVDGHLDEAVWGSAAPATAFTQLDPQEGQPASERTEVRVLVGDGAIFIGARLFDREPAKIRSQLARRDDPADSDLFEVFIDSYHDHLTAFTFRVTPAGAIRDAVLGAGGAVSDASWDPVWEAVTSVDDLGWSAEMRIPLSQLRYTRGADPTWGIQFSRFIYRKQESSFFSFTPKREAAGIDRYGHLVGLGTLPAPRRIELLPYARSRGEYRRVAAGNPFRDGRDFFGGAGLDLKYGLTSNLTLDATINPDFGQVELDPAVVNLTASETFFAERRPFFVEGTDTFRFAQTRAFNRYTTPTFFYSRRIGRAPQGTAPPGARFVDVPDETTIASAAKLTGRTRDGWTIGILDAVTSPEHARFLDSSAARRTATIEPRSNYFVGRARRELRDGNTTVGGLLMDASRDLGEPALAALLRSHAAIGGADFVHTWARRLWSIDGSVLVSHVAGSAAAIAGTQRSSVRYFNRPDIRTVSYDPTRTSLDGYATHLTLARNTGVHWYGSVSYQDVSPAFEVNDLGFQTRADARAVSTALFYKEDKPGRRVRRWSTELVTNQTWNHDQSLISNSYGVLGDLQFTNFWSLATRVDVRPDTLDDRLTRGGPLAVFPAGGSETATVTSDSRRRNLVRVSFTHAWNNRGGWAAVWSGSVSLRPKPALQVRVEPSIQLGHALAQYVTSVADATASTTFGRRYVFATISQTLVSLDSRVDWTFTPRLSLQMYVQPLAASGDYFDFKQLARPRRYAFDVFGRDAGTIDGVPAGYVIDPDGDGPAQPFRLANPDFTLRSLRGNAVLRWEYRPGSTLFFVWQQRRSDTQPFGTFVVGRDFGALLETRPENVFVVKLTYWIAR